VASAHALMVVACHGPVRRTGEEWLEAIRFHGNHAIKDRDLRDGLALERARDQGAAPDPYLVGVDADRIRGAYLRRGFLDVDVHSRVDRRDHAATVTYAIEEGPRATTRVAITGLPDDPDLPVDKVRGKLVLSDGAPFDYEAYDRAKQPLLAVVQDAGYAHARLDARVVADRTRNEAIVELDYVTGPKCRFGKISMEGAPDELADAVRARLAFGPGDQFSQAAIVDSQRAIYDMHRFSTVRVLPDKTDGDTIDVHVSLAESSRHEVSLGGGLGMDPATFEARGRADYSIVGWPLPLYDFGIDLRPAYAMLRDGSGYEPRIRAMAKLRRIELFRPFVVGEVEGGYNFLNYEAYTSYGPRGRVGLQTPLGMKRVQLRVGWQIERLDFRNISSLIDPMLAHQLGLDTTERVGEYQQALVVDLRDNPVEPRLGAYGEVRVAEGTPYAGGALSFVQVTPEVRGYLPIPSTSVVIAGRLRAGEFFGDLPVTERYFSGGSTTQRGFSERRLAPTVFSNVDGSVRSVPIGGGGLVESNLEARAELGKVRGMGVGGTVFLDGGDVTERFSQIDLDNLHWAIGGGVRVLTVVGAFRLDVGYRLNRTGAMEPEPGSHYAFHISIGEAY
jgi:outer membrane protein insertion porin family